MSSGFAKIALGTVQFGLDYGIANKNGQVPFSECTDILRYCKKVGIDTLDTAVTYGQSEELLGRIGVTDYSVVTKLPSVPTDCQDVKSWVYFNVTNSLQRLNVKSIYGILLHHPDDLFGEHGADLIEALHDVKRKGIVHKIGISIYDPIQLDPIMSLTQFDIVQAPVNLVDRRLETSGWLLKLKNDGVEVHSRSTFLQGLLLLANDELPKEFYWWSSIWNRWHEFLKDANISAIAACLAYPISLPQIDRIVVGVDSAQHLKMLVAACQGKSKVFDTTFMISDDKRLINPSNWSVS